MSALEDIRESAGRQSGGRVSRIVRTEDRQKRASVRNSKLKLIRKGNIIGKILFGEPNFTTRNIQYGGNCQQRGMMGRVCRTDR